MKHERRSKRLGKSNHFSSKMLDLDKFSDTVPSFNYKGDQSIKTGIGAFCSITISIIVFYYALIKFIQLLERQNPTIATFSHETKFDPKNPLNLNAINFKAAFQFTAYDSSTYDFVEKNDPNFVKMVVRRIGTDYVNIYEETIPHHKCTEEEYADFYPIESS